MVKAMNVTIRRSVPKSVQNIPQLIEDATRWMQQRYPAVNFSNVEFIFSGGYNRSQYFRNNGKYGNAKYLCPTVCICTRPMLYLYNMKTLKIKQSVLYVGAQTQIMCALIHELTHHMQYETNISRGELATTANELAYLKEYAPKDYEKIMQ